MNSPEAIRTLELVYIIGPIVLSMAAGFCFLGYKLTPERHAEIRRQLDERDAIYAEAPALGIGPGGSPVPAGPAHTTSRRSSQGAESNGPSRNAPCYCGSGKKYKRCHGAPGAA